MLDKPAASGIRAAPPHRTPRRRRRKFLPQAPPGLDRGSGNGAWISGVCGGARRLPSSCHRNPAPPSPSKGSRLRAWPEHQPRSARTTPPGLPDHVPPRDATHPTSRLRPFHAGLTGPVFTARDERTLLSPAVFSHLLISSHPGNEGPPAASKTHPRQHAQALLFRGPRVPPNTCFSAATATKERRPRRGRRARFHDRHRAERLPGMERARRG
jgi:hypothetical protein